MQLPTTYSRLAAWLEDEEEVHPHCTASDRLRADCGVNGDTVLHSMVSIRTLTAAMLDLLVEVTSESDCWKVRNSAGRTPMHSLCANPSISAPRRALLCGAAAAALFPPLSSAAGEAAPADCRGWTPLHVLCANDAIGAVSGGGGDSDSGALALRLLLRAHPATAVTQADGGRGPTALHLLCRNGAVTSTLLRVYLDEATARGRGRAAASVRTAAFHTPLHWIAANPAATASAVALLLDADPSALRSADAHGSTLLHTLCTGPAATPALFTLLLRRGADPTRRNATGVHPFALLASNPRVSLDALLRCVRRWEEEEEREAQQHQHQQHQQEEEVWTQPQQVWTYDAGSDDADGAPTLCTAVRAYAPPLACISAAACVDRVRRALQHDARALDRRDARGASPRDVARAANLGSGDPVLRALARGGGVGGGGTNSARSAARRGGAASSARCGDRGARRSAHGVDLRRGQGGSSNSLSTAWRRRRGGREGRGDGVRRGRRCCWSRRWRRLVPTQRRGDRRDAEHIVGLVTCYE